MSETMIERIAQLVHWHVNPEASEIVAVTQAEVQTARDILIAMREPTEAMKAAWLGNGHQSVTAKRDWRAMIDAALVEGA